MIESISTDISKSKMFKYAKDLEVFKNNERIEFKPGLNILFGWNGSGKSTVLKIIGHTMAAVQSGSSVITARHLRETTDYIFGESKVIDTINIDVVHDGQSITYKDFNHEEHHFDDDFFGMSVDDMFTRSGKSTGEIVLIGTSKIIKLVKDSASIDKAIRYVRDGNNVTRDDFYGRINEVWQSKLEVSENRLKPKLDKLGQYTILLDEPDSNTGFVPQMSIWDFFKKKSVVDKFQLIVATHSVASLGIKGANYIDFDKGEYREKCISKLKELNKRFT